jgi:hypothetical protein
VAALRTDSGAILRDFEIGAPGQEVDVAGLERFEV